MFSNIVLIGFMGTGKTTIGGIVSRKLGFDFIDTDVEIIKKCGKSIHEIFKEKGEKHFREIESGIIDEVSKLNNVVIACGGGVVKNRTNMEKLGKKGFIVCLRADIDTIYKRIASDKLRPLAEGKTKREILCLMNQRAGLYGHADIFIDTNDINPYKAADNIIQAFLNTMQ